MLNPVGQTINVVRAFDAQLDAWRGGALLAQTHFNKQTLNEYCFTKEQYEECGHHYLKEHFCSNYMYGPGSGNKKFRV